MDPVRPSLAEWRVLWKACVSTEALRSGLTVREFTEQ